MVVRGGTRAVVRRAGVGSNFGTLTLFPAWPYVGRYAVMCANFAAVEFHYYVLAVCHVVAWAIRVAVRAVAGAEFGNKGRVEGIKVLPGLLFYGVPSNEGSERGSPSVVLRFEGAVVARRGEGWMFRFVIVVRASGAEGCSVDALDDADFDTDYTCVWDESVVDEEVLDFYHGLGLVVDGVFAPWRSLRVVLVDGDINVDRYDVVLLLDVAFLLREDLAYYVYVFVLRLMHFVGFFRRMVVAVREDIAIWRWFL